MQTAPPDYSAPFGIPPHAIRFHLFHFLVDELVERFERHALLADDIHSEHPRFLEQKWERLDFDRDLLLFHEPLVEP